MCRGRGRSAKGKATTRWQVCFIWEATASAVPCCRPMDGIIYGASLCERRPIETPVSFLQCTSGRRPQIVLTFLLLLGRQRLLYRARFEPWTRN